MAQTRDRIKTIDWSFAGRIEFWFEAMWLGALGMVPLLFSYSNSLVTFEETKSYAVHFFGLATFVLLVADITNNYVIARRRGDNPGSIDVGAWLRADRSNLLLGAIGLFVFVYIISTALSQLPFYSLWSVTPGISGYSLYTFLSMMVILLAIVTKVRTAAQVWRILGLIVFVGTLASIYGTSQHFDFDPIAVVEQPDRVLATFGNPIYFGAYLSISIPITLAMASHERARKNWRVLLLLAVATGLQLAAMWFTGSRGPLVGLVGGISAMGFATLLLMSRRQIASVAGVLAAGITIAIVVILIPSGTGQGARAVQFSGELSALAEQNAGAGIQGGLRGRSEIWGDVLEISTNWETFQEDEGIARALRPLFGLGPDMLRYASSLVARPRSTLEIVDHAHNRILHVLAEQGWIGLITFLTIIGLAAWLLFLTGKMLFRARSAENRAVLVLFIAVTGALAGTAAEQLSGVGRVSDLLTSWVLIGLLVVLYRHVVGHRKLITDGVEPEGRIKNQPRANSSQLGISPTLSAIPFFFGLVALIVAILIFTLSDVQILRASRTVFAPKLVETRTELFDTYVDARDTAPQVEHFTIFPVQLLVEDARSLSGSGDIEQALPLAERAYTLLLDFHERNPLAFRTRILMAETAALLFELGLEGFGDEMILRYEDLAKQFPNEARVISVVANAYASARQFEQSLAIADRAIELEAQTEPLPSPYWVRGVALARLDRQTEAIAAHETAIDKSPESIFARLAHEDLVKIYEDMGDDENAEFHREAAIELGSTSV